MPESSGEAGEEGWRAARCHPLLLLPPLEEPGGEVSRVDVSGRSRRPSNDGGDGTVNGSGWPTAAEGNCAAEQSGVEAERGTQERNAV